MSSISFTYKGMQMVVFDRYGSDGFASTAPRSLDEEKIIKDLWLKGKLGQKDGEGIEFTIMPIPDQVIGEEVFAKDHRIVCDFRLCRQQQFCPEPRRPKGNFLRSYFKSRKKFIVKRAKLCFAAATLLGVP